ncbi:MAG: DUF4097 family beta strand repeat-containing protein, partial [Pseudomonadota bacterium]
EVNQSLPAAEGGKVRFKIVDGNVTFKGWDQNEVRVTGQLGANTKGLVFENDGAETLIKVETDKDYFNNNRYFQGSPDTELSIFMPENSWLFANSTSGDVQIDGLKAGSKTKNVSGDITISNSGKYVKAYTSSGDVKVYKCTGEVHIETVSGDIDAEVQARRFEATTISGDVEGWIGDTYRVEMSSVSGDLEVAMNLADDGSIEASTVSGDIELLFKQEEINAYFDMDTGPGGEIENNITDSKATGSWAGSEDLELKLGKGSAVVELETMSGTIEIAQR